jgi:hypothetical protein
VDRDLHCRSGVARKGGIRSAGTVGFPPYHLIIKKGPAAPLGRRTFFVVMVRHLCAWRRTVGADRASRGESSGLANRREWRASVCHSRAYSKQDAKSLWFRNRGDDYLCAAEWEQPYARLRKRTDCRAVGNGPERSRRYSDPVLQWTLARWVNPEGIILDGTHPERDNSL